MVKRVIPAVTNEVITLVKDTSLASVIGTVEMFTRAKQIVASPNTPGMLALVAAGVFYYVFNYVIAFAMENGSRRCAITAKGRGEQWQFLKCGTPEKAFGALEVLKGVSLKVEKARSCRSSAPRAAASRRCCAARRCLRPWTLARSRMAKTSPRARKTAKASTPEKPRSRRCGGSSGWCSSSLTSSRTTQC